MIRRNIEPYLEKAAQWYPVLTLTGPRQSGKTTTSRAVFPDHDYVSLEAPDVRQWALSDPRGFLGQFKRGVILDEIQNAPDLPSYIQGMVDQDDQPGRFVLTGSHHLAISESVAQSLAGRSAVLHLLPLGFDELTRFETSHQSLWEVVFAGGYPRIFDRQIPPERWLSDYVATYIQRDVRQILNVGDLNAFTTFLRLVAGRTGQELNLSSLGGDAGVSHNTARAWLSVLDASFLTWQLPAFSTNLRKRLVKAPKLHYLDSGLACFLLGIRSADQLVTHPLRGAIFESWVASEVYKHLVHQGLSTAHLSHLRVTRGEEIDIVVDAPKRLLIETMSGATVQPSFFKDILSLGPELDANACVVYGGEEMQERQGCDVVGWNGLVEWLHTQTQNSPDK